MASKSATTLNMTRIVKRVKLLPYAREFTGAGHRLTTDLADGSLDVFGTQLVDYGDGSHTNCYLVENKDGALVSRAMDLFSVEEVAE